MRRRRSKKAQASPIALLIALVVLLGISTLGARVADNAVGLLPLLLAIGVALMLTIGFYIWKVEQKRRAAQRAMELADIDALDGVAFERYIGDILLSQGYHIRYTPRSGDDGVDLLASKGKQTYGIQAKRYKGSVGNHAVMEAHTGAAHYHAQKAIVVTTSHFTARSRLLAASTGVRLIDREELAMWILTFQNVESTTAKGRISLD